MDSILIVGAGSVGTLIGITLIKAGFSVSFAGRPESHYTKLIKKQGLKITYYTGESFWLAPDHPNAHFTTTKKNLKEKFSLIIVALKSNDLIKASNFIKTHSTSKTIIIHAQNGIPYWWFNDEKYLKLLNRELLATIKNRPYLESIDPQRKLLQQLGDRQLVGCVVKAPCQKTPDGCIKVKKAPKLILGLTNNHSNTRTRETIQKLCEIFSLHNLLAEFTENIRVAVCQKLAVNVTTNVLSALTGKTIADLTANDYTNSLIKSILAEIKQIFQLYGIKAADLPTEAQVYGYIQTPGSQSHLPSLAQDFSQHRQGEVSLITAPVEMAEIANYQVPTLSSLAKLLQLGQTYTLKTSTEKSHILTFDHPRGYCLFTKDVYQSNLFDKWYISENLTHLVQVNIAAVRSLSYSL